MKNLKFIFLFVFIPILSYSQYVLQEGYISLHPHTNTGSENTYKNLRIYPLTCGGLFQKAHEGIGSYTNLEEALKKDKILITEKFSSAENIEIEAFEGSDDYPDGSSQYNGTSYQAQGAEIDGEVNKLFVENTSSDTIYLMAGEVIKGGKQDRVLAQDMILPPAGGKVEIPVFCVEHHRWSAGSSGANFEEYFTVSSNSIRGKVVKEKNQSEVWETVEGIVVNQDAESSTGTYAALEDSESYNEALDDYQKFFTDRLADVNECIGFVGVTGNRIIGCDIFATHELFSQQSKNLLNAYISEAINDGEMVKIKDKIVLSYLKEFLSDESSQEEVVNAKGMEFKHNGKKLHLNTY